MLKGFIVKYVLLIFLADVLLDMFKITENRQDMWCANLMSCIAAGVAKSAFVIFNKYLNWNSFAYFLVGSSVVFILISQLKSFTFVEVLKSKV